MNIISRAIKEYSNANYALALSLFKEAGSIFGEHIVKYHINKCEQVLKSNDNYNQLHKLGGVILDIPK